MRLSEAHSEAAYFGSGIEVTDPPVVARFAVVGEPMTKARARVVTTKSGKTRAFTPDATKAAQARVTAAYLTSVGRDRRPPDGEHTFGVRAVFFRSDNQRRDVDNMLKLVLDGLTGTLWKDDSQVVEVFGRKTLASPQGEPRTEVVVYRAGDVALPTAACEQCGKPFRTYKSLAARRFCNRQCGDAWRKVKRARTCRHCGAEFDPGRAGVAPVYCGSECQHAATHVTVTCAGCSKQFDKPRSLNRHGNSYCSDECRAAYWRARGLKRDAGTCQDCGGPTSKKVYKRCHACNAKAGGRWANREKP